MPELLHPDRRLLRRLTAILVLTFVFAAATLPLPMASAAPSSQAPARLVLAFRSDLPAHSARRIAARHGTIVEEIRALHVEVVELPPASASAAVARLLADRRITHVEADGRVSVDWTPNDELWASQWEKRRMKLDRAWDVELGDRSTVIAVVDTGVQAKHPDLYGHVLPGRDFVNEDAKPVDDNGHGTAVAGVAAAIADNSIGIAGACGKCRILPVKVLDANGMGWWTVAAQGIVWATNHGADVINMSFTGPTGGEILGSAVDYARAHGVVVVAAAGNQGSTAPGYPAAYPGVISVAASTGIDARYSWSNWSRSWVNLAAPGCTWATHRRGTYGGFCGTSAATPLVAGVAGLVRSLRPQKSRAWVESVLLASGRLTVGSYTRYGRLDAWYAIRLAQSSRLPVGAELLPEDLLFEPWRVLDIAPGPHTAYRFDRSGSILAKRKINRSSWTAPSTSASTIAIPWHEGETWYYVASGPLTGYWLQQGDGVEIRPEPSPTPSSTPQPSSSPAPNG